MKLIAESGLWTTGPQVAPPPSAAVLEIAGAILEWTVTDAVDAVRITFTDIDAADWLWRLVGAEGHAALVAAAPTPTHDGQVVEINGANLASEPVAALRRLAFGHWLRRWWPAGRVDAIEELDGALLDAEIALLTTELQEYFSQDTFDSDIAELLTPNRAALTRTIRAGDPRARDLVRAATTVAEDIGLGGWSDLLERHHDDSPPRRDDYALAAGGAVRDASDPIARGVDTVRWTSVPPRIFDAGDNTVDWSVHGAAGAAVARIRIATLGSADGIALRFDSGAITGHATLTGEGTATVELVDADGSPASEEQAWAHHWAGTRVTVGAGAGESEAVRELIRDFARRRLAQPGPDSFLAEILAAEADY